jgi:hypothetical protein
MYATKRLNTIPESMSKKWNSPDRSIQKTNIIIEVKTKFI